MKSLNKKELKESLKKCKKILSEKRLSESSFKDLIKPFLDLLDQVHQAKQNGDLDLPPIDDDKIDIKTVLSTKESELASDGTLTESVRNKNKSLKEESRTYQDIVNDYKNQGGSEDYNDWKAWLENQNEADKTKGNILNKYNFNARYLRASNNVANVSEQPAISKPDYKPSAELSNLIDLIDANTEFTESAVTTVSDKYETIELLLRRVIRGKSTKRYYLLAGDPGIGKTYTVEKLLEEEGKTDVETCTGSIGRSVTSIAIFLWTHKDDELVILDDCDSFLRKGNNIDVVNILKGCMEAGTGYKVGIPQNIASRATKLLKVTENKKSNISDKVRALFEADEELDDEESIDTNEEELIDTNDAEVIPTSWTFNARLIILSNLHESQIEEALWSRCDHFDLHLTQEEYLVRLAMIIDDMDIGQKDGLLTDEEAKEAKALTFSVMKSVIEAGNNGVKLFGKYVKLTSHLEFRIVKDLCNMWLAMLDRELETHPDEDKDTAKKAILKKWVRIGVIPRLSVSSKL